MKKLFLLVILIATPIFASTSAPESLYSGYADVAGVDDINATFVNPAALTRVNMHDIYIVFTSPLAFRSFALPIPFSDKYTAGIGIEDDGILQKVRLALPFMNFNRFKAGATFGLDREYPRTLDRTGFAFDLGFIVPFQRIDKNNFSLTWAISFRNLINKNSFTAARLQTYSDIDTGLRVELFVKNLFLNLGGNYHLDKFTYSVGLEALLFKSIDLGLCMKGDNIAIGTALHLKNSALTFALNVVPNSDDFWSLGYNFYLKPKMEPKKIQLPTVSNTISAAQLQRKQKILLDKGIELYKTKEYELARTNWNQCIQLGPNSDTAREAKKYLDRVNTILNNLK